MYSNAVSYVHEVLSQRLKKGDVVIDATIGNGWDTAFMSELVGETGVVYGFDIQQIAIDVTHARLKGAKADVRLLLQSHEHILSSISANHIGQVSAITFNLGYLPGGDQQISTLASTTRIGLEQARSALSSSGVLTVVCYQHKEGEEEIAIIREYLSQWPQYRYTVVEIAFINQIHKPPVVFVVTARPYNPNDLSV